MATKDRTDLISVEDVPIQDLCLEDIGLILRQPEIPILTRGHRGGLRQIRTINHRELEIGSLNLLPEA